MVFVTPVVLEVLLVVLVGGSVDTQCAIRVIFRLIVLGELAFQEGLGIVLGCAGGDGRGIQADERSIQDAKLIELLHLFPHEILKDLMTQFTDKAVKSPVGRQRPGDVKAAVVGNKQITVEKVHQIADLGKAFGLHDDESTEESLLRETFSTGRRSRQLEVQLQKEFVVKNGDALGCEQSHILNDFLAVDSGSPLSVWFLAIPFYPNRAPLST